MDGRVFQGKEKKMQRFESVKRVLNRELQVVGIF